jgi:hypothetical protein
MDLTMKIMPLKSRHTICPTISDTDMVIVWISEDVGTPVPVSALSWNLCDANIYLEMLYL